MKSEKGITLTGLVIYIIGAFIIFTIVANITIYFNKNSREIKSSSYNSLQYSRFNQYLISDLKQDNVNINISETALTVINNNEEIIYKILGNGIYRNKVKICDEIASAKFLEENLSLYGKKKLIINITVGTEEKLDKNLEFII